VRIRSACYALILIAAVIRGRADFAIAQDLKAPDTTPTSGFLTCHVESGFGFIFGSTRNVACTYSTSSGQSENYKGHIHKFGADIGYLSSAVILWGVYAHSTIEGPGVLVGDYTGATVSATVGIGGGLNVLAGGSEKSITLQPISIEGNQGLNIGAGIMQMTLEYVKP